MRNTNFLNPMKGNMMQLIKQTLTSQHGGFLIVAAIAIPVLLMMTGAAVDTSRYIKASSYIQSAADQAAVAAAGVDAEDRKAVAERFFMAGLSESAEYIELNDLHINEEFVDGQELVITVTADADMKTMFGGFLGMSEINVQKLGESTRMVKNVEAVLTLAMSGTMCAGKTRIPNNSAFVEGDTLISLEPDNCGTFDKLKEGVNAFMDIVSENETVADFRIGLVPYNYKVAMPDLNRIPPSLEANEAGGFFETVHDAQPLSDVVPLTSNLADIRQAVQEMQTSAEATAWSRTDLASHVAGLMLDPGSHEYFGGDTPTGFDDRQTEKIVILMTDGANIGCCYTNWPLGDFTNQYVYYYEPYDEHQREVCTRLKENGVKVYSILLDVRESDPGGAIINDTFARCATPSFAEANSSSPLNCQDTSNCFNVATDDELLETFRQIAKTFYRPTITE